jgi:hypothetical protein
MTELFLDKLGMHIVKFCPILECYISVLKIDSDDEQDDVAERLNLEWVPDLRVGMTKAELMSTLLGEKDYFRKDKLKSDYWNNSLKGVHKTPYSVLHALASPDSLLGSYSKFPALIQQSIDGFCKLPYMYVSRQCESENYYDDRQFTADVTCVATHVKNTIFAMVEDARQKPRPISILDIALEGFADGRFDNKIGKFYYDDDKKERPPTESTLDYLDLDYGQVRPHFSSILSRM